MVTWQLRGPGCHSNTSLAYDGYWVFDINSYNWPLQKCDSDVSAVDQTYLIEKKNILIIDSDSGFYMW